MIQTWNDFDYNDIVHTISEWVKLTNNYVVGDVGLKSSWEFNNPVLLISYYDDTGKDLCDLSESLFLHMRYFVGPITLEKDFKLQFPIQWEQI